MGQARVAGLEVLGELELGWRLVPNEFIAVTGTNGKTTTVELIGAMHRADLAPVAVAGNVGTPVSSLAGRLEPEATVVCEASSFQLEDTIAFAPEAAVFLNFSEDHLDRHETMTSYLRAKMRIFANQKLSDLAVIDGNDPDLEWTHVTHGAPIPARKVTFGFGPDLDVRMEDGSIVWRDQPVIDADDVRLRGRFNLKNAMAATAVCLERGVGIDGVRAALREFAGLPHRLEHVAEIDGVEYVNDSKATNPDAAAAALEAFGARGVHAIMGGSAKGDTDFESLQNEVALNCRAVYLIGESAKRIRKALRDTDVELLRCGSLDRAVRGAARRAKPGEVVLLAPACASFDQYRDFEERGEHFRALVGELA